MYIHIYIHVYLDKQIQLWSWEWGSGEPKEFVEMVVRLYEQCSLHEGANPEKTKIPQNKRGGGAMKAQRIIDKIFETK
jgi:hypothetical protein